jgi:acetyltransferase-like isoleucine patch superfamily enzyme
MEVGRHTYGHEQIDVRHWGEAAKLEIGSFCSIADRVVVLLGGNHQTEWVTTFPFPAFRDRWPTAPEVPDYVLTNGDVRIGNDVWIGSNATIMSGATIGDGAVVAADSCVTRDVPPYAIVGGNPAVVVRRRFDDRTIAGLLAIRWWDWSDERIAASMEQLCSADVEGFVRAHGGGGAR